MAKRNLAEWQVNDPNMSAIERALMETAARVRTGEQNSKSYQAYKSHPVGFINNALGAILWDRQMDIAKSVRDNFRTIVPAGHAVGKTFLSVGIAAWWLSTRKMAKIVVLAPTFSQLNNVFFRGLRKTVTDNGLPGEVFQTPKWNIADERFCVGLSPKKTTLEDMAALQGYHSPNLLVILDEAPGLPRIMWEAVEGLATGANDRILALGNPIAQNGPFWNACNSPSWNMIQVSCLGHPNVVNNEDTIPGAVSWRWVNDMVTNYCTRVVNSSTESFMWEGNHYEPSAVAESKLLGRAPQEASDQLISLAWVSAAMGWVADDGESDTVGVDPARYGGDNITLVRRRGGKTYPVQRMRLHSLNPTDEVTGWIQANSKGAAKIFVDEIGIGAGILDRCRSVGLPVVGVGFGRGANENKRFTNVRAECWWRMREALQQGHISLPQDDELTGDLTSPKYWYDKSGRVLLEPKEDIKNRIGRSPDAADALALTYALPEQRSDLDMTNPKLTSVSRWKDGGSTNGVGLFGGGGDKSSRWSRR